MTEELIKFESFNKLYRLNGPVIVTEKIDGTNAQILITDDGRIFAGSRTRFITPTADNHGFAKWVYANEDKLKEVLGVGRHYGEWWGNGIQRGYGLKVKMFSLFNTSKWDTQEFRNTAFNAGIGTYLSVVSVLFTGTVLEVIERVPYLMDKLRLFGSIAAPGYMNPEGIVIYDTRSGTGFKKTFDYDDTGKGNQRDEHGNVV